MFEDAMQIFENTIDVAETGNRAERRQAIKVIKKVLPHCIISPEGLARMEKLKIKGGRIK